MTVCDGDSVEVAGRAAMELTTAAERSYRDGTPMFVLRNHPGQPVHIRKLPPETHVRVEAVASGEASEDARAEEVELDQKARADLRKR